MAVVFTGINSQQEKKRQNLSSKWHRNKTDFVHANLEKTISAVKKVRCFFKFGVCENGICVEKSLLLYIYAYIYTCKKKKKKKKPCKLYINAQKNATPYSRTVVIKDILFDLKTAYQESTCYNRLLIFFINMYI